MSMRIRIRIRMKMRMTTMMMVSLTMMLTMMMIITTAMMSFGGVVVDVDVVGWMHAAIDARSVAKRVQMSQKRQHTGK